MAYVPWERKVRDVRVVVFLVDSVNLRPSREIHIVVRALQACRRVLSMQDAIRGCSGAEMVDGGESRVGFV